MNRLGSSEPCQSQSPLMVRGLRAASELTGLSTRTVWSLVNRNALPHRRIGRALLFVPDELRAWVRMGCPTDAGAADRIKGDSGHG